MSSRCRDDRHAVGARCRRGVGDAVGVEYVSRVPRPPLDGLIDDLYERQLTTR
jgi:hypothetical protein